MNTNKKPNIITITCHDTGKHFGCYGFDTVSSPAIDALAEDGALFTNYFAVSPVCSPSRASQMTGRYPQSNGLMGLIHEPWEWAYNDGERHLSHILRDAGYHTVLFGFQHESTDLDLLGFAEMQTEHRRCKEVSSEVVHFLENRGKAAQPFYAQIGFSETHLKFHSEPDDSKGVYVPPVLLENDEAKSFFAHLQGEIRMVDHAVQSIWDALRENDLEDETIFIFTIDHGIEYPRAKHFCYDAGLEIALVMRWPEGGIKGGKKIDKLLSNVDFLPSLLDLVDLPIPQSVEGKSFKQLIHDDQAEATRSEIFGIYEGINTPIHPSVSRAVRTDRYKLIRNFFPCREHELPIDISNPIRKRKCPVVQLFDLKEDPHEVNNVAYESSYSDVFKELDSLLFKWLTETRDPILQGPVRTPYYNQAMEIFGGGK